MRKGLSVGIILFLMNAQLTSVAGEKTFLTKSPIVDNDQEIFCAMHANPKKIYIGAKNNTDRMVLCDIRCDVTKDEGSGTFALHARGVRLLPNEDSELIRGFRNADGYYTGILGGEFNCTTP